MNVKRNKAQVLMLCGAVLALTALRFSVATCGGLNETEALLSVCGTHPAGGFVEGPAGVPLLLFLERLFCGSGLGMLRWISPLASLLFSWSLWRIGRHLAPHRSAVALWAVLGVNLLPVVTMTSLVMDGAMVTASVILLAVLAGWYAVEARAPNKGSHKKAKSHGGTKVPVAWALFGGILGLGTLFFYPIGWLLPAALAACCLSQGFKAFPWRGALVALGLLALGWVFPLAWNARHDWVQWSSVAEPFGSMRWEAPLQLSPWLQAALGASLLVPLAGIVFLLLEAWREELMRRLLLFALPLLAALSWQIVSILRGAQSSVSLGLLMAVSALLFLPAIALLLSGRVWRWVISLAILLFACGSAAILYSPSQLPPGFPSPIGVQGVGDLAREVVSLRKERSDAKGERSFLIAATPGLAALLGEKIGIDYPERPGAPSVFVAESPSMNSSYALWPSYADAVAAGVKDPLYTEEKTVSPFLGRNALYITTEPFKELPQTITGAFNAVGLLKEVVLNWNGRLVTVRIYQCEGYRTLAL